MTDGFQIKLPLLSLRNNRTPGIDCLFDRGFTGFKKNKEMQKIDTGKLKNGIYVFGKQDLYMEEEDMKNHIFVGFDPGRNKPVSACSLDGDEMPFRLRWER